MFVSVRNQFWDQFNDSNTFFLNRGQAFVGVVSDQTLE